MWKNPTCELPYLGGHCHGQYAKEENALKAKLRRLCEVKKGGRLQVPDWLHNEWKNGDHMKLARQFEACNFSKETITQTFFCINAFQVSISIDLAIHIPTSRLCQSKDALHPAYLSWRDHFIKYKETTRTKSDSKSSNVGNGWYSREDMSKVLKWNKTLSCIQVKTQCPTHVFLQSYVVDVGIQNTTS